MRNPISRRRRSRDRNGPAASEQIPVRYVTRITHRDHSVVVLERQSPIIWVQHDGVEHASRESRDLLTIGLLRVVRHVERLVDDARLTEKPRLAQDAHIHAWAEG